MDLNKLLEYIQTVLKENLDPNLPYSSKSNIEDRENVEKMKIAIRKNEFAMSSFAIAFTKEAVMRSLSRAKTKEWP
jgi:hypothetical protein